MARTTRFREQHVDILQLANELRSIGPERLAQDGGPARQLLSRLLGKLNLHLAVEDRSLYPELRKSSDAKIASMAVQFETEMGGIAEKVIAWGKRWSTAATIQAEPGRFIIEGTEIMDVLKKRLAREHKDLYPALDAM